MKAEYGCSCSTCVILRAQEREILIGKDPVPAPYPLTWSEPIQPMRPGLRRYMPTILMIGGFGLFVGGVAAIGISMERSKLPEMSSPDSPWACYGESSRYTHGTWTCRTTQADGKTYIFNKCEMAP